MILNKRQFVLSGATLLIVLAALAVASILFGERRKPPVASADGHLSCDSTQYLEYNKIMAAAGEMTVGRQVGSGTREQQQRMLDAFQALALPKEKSVIAAGHFPTGKLYVTTCENERCTFDEMGTPRRTCTTESWDDCPYLAMQFREKRYCLLQPADQ